MRPVRQLIRERMSQGRNKAYEKRVEDEEEKSIMHKIKPRWMPVFHDHDSSDDIFSPRLSKERKLPRPSRPRVSRSKVSKNYSKEKKLSRSKVSKSHSQEKKINEREKKKKIKSPFIEPGVTRTMRLRKSARLEKQSRQVRDRKVRKLQKKKMHIQTNRLARKARSRSGGKQMRDMIRESKHKMKMGAKSKWQVSNITTTAESHEHSLFSSSSPSSSTTPLPILSIDHSKPKSSSPSSIPAHTESSPSSSITSSSSTSSPPPTPPPSPPPSSSTKTMHFVETWEFTKEGGIDDITRTPKREEEKGYVVRSRNPGSSNEKKKLSPMSGLSKMVSDIEASLRGRNKQEEVDNLLSEIDGIGIKY